jgi:FkbM family methyltransferase
MKSIKFKGKGRLVNYWVNSITNNDIRTRGVGEQGKIMCDVSVPYEAMVWLEREEQADLEILKKLLKPGDTFVDCGANIGLWTIFASEQVKKNGKVFSFEPNPHTFKKLQHNINISLCNNVYSKEVALGKESGKAYINCDFDHNESQISTLKKNIDTVVKVRIEKLDSLLNAKTITGLKIDVEGYELNVLKGAEKIINQNKPWICVEFNTLLANTNILGEWPVHNYLSKLGYKAQLFSQANAPKNNILPENWSTKGYCNLFYKLKMAN